ncbi:4,5-DOPA dioxygenase extradiol [Cocleimonas sp. KMM 6892]|uniref:4,5-DOPA-extradiol-dioxygenase n=1 Tax=unclassified Cocleimonas TaxID=2639732 RepID=UPI002DB5DEAF|nr:MULTISPECIES: 4,5-DOPA dioxygenase extradiol [unclassified Cocleimonas]MEB8433059.1 4,5-DOPA dioxygenase extradiol [Cocleimonas sp. KMM 6892]MEC4715960.1 4,5-DOPA dioxygenase extradiol [Cocleimonas sp. KMM 6895]MEC4745421.1 4,5-DOPA dioxygenase extradiol [Cocleimonas sp. KMM 6896]
MNRRQWLKFSTLAGLGLVTRTWADTFSNSTLESLKALPKSPTMPVMFIGHGSPMNAINENAFNESWRKIGKQFGEGSDAKWTKPSAILVISAHWQTTGGIGVLASEEPEIIYDFGGFPQKLYDQTYPAPGSLTTAEITKQLLQTQRHTPNTPIILDEDRGFDHGVWSVLLPMFPKADIPVLQISLDRNLPHDIHYDLAKQLSALRERGVLIIGSGNMVHNLYAKRMPNSKPYDWTLEFEQKMTDWIEHRDDQSIIKISRTMPKLTSLAHPTHEHFLPLIYTLGAKSAKDKISFFNSGYGSSAIAMRSVIFEA